MTPPPGNGVEVGTRPGERYLRVTGPLAIVALFSLLIMAGTGWLVWHQLTVQHEEHLAIIAALDRSSATIERATCIALLPPDVRLFASAAAANKRRVDEICASWREGMGTIPR